MTAEIKIPGYEIKRLLGRGGMAAVYLAIQESFGREVALKVLSPDHPDQSFSERFLREARIVSRLTHPNIVTVYDVGIHEGYHYLSMEYIQGRDLGQAYASLSRVEAVRVIKDVARALDYAGNKGYVHRDVKPENIMIHEDGRVFLMDFGIARGQEVTQGITQTGKAIGTPYYMSPEQTKGLDVDRRSDIYSLGVVLYQMLAGYVPFDAPSAVAVGIKHLSAPIPNLPASMKLFQPIINTCMSKNPDHRYQTGGELVNALNAIPEQQISAMEASAAAMRQAGQNYDAATVVGTDMPLPTPPQAETVMTPPPSPAAANKTAVTRVHDEPKPRRRRTFLLLVLIATLGWAGYTKQDEFIRLWHTQLHPLIAGTVPGNPAEPAAAATDSIPLPDEPAVTDEAVTAATDSPLTAEQRIAQLLEQRDDQPEHAVELAQLYKAMLRDQPTSPMAREGIKELRDWYAQQIRTAADAEDVARARQLFDLMKSSFPRAAATPKARELEAKLQRAERVQAHLQRARDYRNLDAVTEPPGANALEELQAALRLAPEHAKTQQAIQAIADSFLSQAEEKQSDGQLQSALTLVNKGLLANPEDAALLSLHTRLQSGLSQQKKINAKLAQADKQLKAKRLITPAGNSAYDHYQAALKLDANNRRAQSGLNTIEQELVKLINLAINGRQLERAERLMAAAKKHYSHSALLGRTEKTLLQVIDAERPKVTKVIFSDTGLSSMQDQSADKLQPGRTLYIGFAYKNFDESTSLLQATLLDGAGRVQIAQKPVIVIGETGEHFFSIELPVEGFADGSYVLELSLANKSLIKSSFLVNNASQL